MGYKKQDIEELTTHEYYEILTSDFLQHTKKLEYWNDLSKFAFLAQKVFEMLNGGQDSPTIEELIGEPPQYGEAKPVEAVNDAGRQWIDWARKKGLEVKQSGNSIKIKRAT